MKTAIGILLRLICYPALFIVVAGVGIMFFLSVSGVCPKFELSGIHCISRFYDDLASYGIAFVPLAMFNGYPLVLALGGLVFLVRDLIVLVRHRRAKAIGAGG